MSTPVKYSITIIQGTTQRVPLVRQWGRAERDGRHLPEEYQK